MCPLNPSTREAEARESLGGPGQPSLHNELFPGLTERPCSCKQANKPTNKRLKTKVSMVAVQRSGGRDRQPGVQSKSVFILSYTCC